MKCPVCKQAMRKVKWEITNNFRVGKEYKEYDKVTYKCADDDVWVSVESPLGSEPSNQPGV